MTARRLALGALVLACAAGVARAGEERMLLAPPPELRDKRVQAVQSGYGNVAAVRQVGVGNLAEVSQSGGSNTASVDQSGAYNATKLVQDGGQYVLVYQQGALNRLLPSQVPGQPALILQRGVNAAPTVVPLAGKR